MEIIVGYYKISTHFYESPDTSTYGFIVYDNDGRSLPKGCISSYNVYRHKNSLDNRETYVVEFGIQSPTGDSSDHHHFSFPCLSWSQAKQVVDIQFDIIQAGLREYSKLQTPV